MVIPVNQGKEQKDRYVMLSPRLLEILRDWWRVEKTKQWLFPGDFPGGHISKSAVQLGINYLDSANAYGPCQMSYGEAFRRLHLTPSDPNYNAALRQSLFVNSKTMSRYSFNPPPFNPGMFSPPAGRQGASPRGAGPNQAPPQGWAPPAQAGRGIPAGFGAATEREVIAILYTRRFPGQ